MTNRASESAEVRDDFIEALLRLFKENPTDDISVGALCTKAGYSRSTFYRYFESLEEVHEALENRSVPTSAMERLLEGGGRVGMEEITNLFLESLSERKQTFEILFTHDKNGRFFGKLKASMKPVFRMQAERAFDMTPFEYDVIAEYLTTAKLSLLRMWVLSPIDLDLAYMTKITDATLEGGLWDRIDEASRCLKSGSKFHRCTIEELAATRPWIAYRYKTSGAADGGAKSRNADKRKSQKF